MVAPCDFNLNTTYHVAMVYDGSTLKFYRNGFLLKQINATGNLLTNNFTTKIGTTADLTTIHPTDFIGQINEVRIWTVARTAQQIKSFVNTSLPSPSTQVGLQAYYIFNSLNNLEGNTAWNATIIGNASINSTNPTCSTFSADSCSVSAAEIGIKQGLMAYYPFNGNAGDSSGNANHPSFNNATLAEDRFGKPNRAYYFNGTNNYMRIPNSSSLNADSAISIALWINVKGFYQGQCHGNIILIKGLDNMTNNYSALYSDAVYTNQQNCSINTVNEYFQQFYGVGTAVAPNNYIQKDTWYFLTYTVSNTVAKLYINGVLQSTTNYINKFNFRNNYDLFIGRYTNASTTPYWMNATIDDLRIYNKALTTDDITYLYNENTTPLPVVLAIFSASKKQNDAVLNWTVSSETN
ncbi:MAG: LamG-like jellyroll fold domain-containing protein, partial [Dolichospermum sp.]